MTRQEMLERMTVEELNDWLVLSTIAPYGEDHLDLLHGIQCSLLANIHRDPKRKSSAWKPSDFLPWQEKPQAGMDIASFMHALIKAQNSKPS